MKQNKIKISQGGIYVNNMNNAMHVVVSKVRKTLVSLQYEGSQGIMLVR